MQINPINNPLVKKSPSFGSVGSVANKIANSKIIKGMEFNGIDMAFPVLMGVMIAGVFVPRLKNAQDKYDREEILRRDLVCITTLGVGSKIFSKLFSKYNESKSGFALATKPDGFVQKSLPKKILQYFRPVNGVKPLTSSQIVSKYSDVAQYKNGLEGFCQFISQQGGNLKKLFSFTPETKGALEGIMGGAEQFAKADNKSITNAIKGAMENGSGHIQTILNQFKGGADIANNQFVKKAKAMNSKFGFLSTIVLVPVLLGIGIPKLNEKITKSKIAARNKQNPASPATVTFASAASSGVLLANQPIKEVFKSISGAK